MKSMFKQILDENQNKQCIILNMKSKKNQRKNPSSNQQVSKNGGSTTQLTQTEIGTNFKLNTIFIITRDHSLITIEKYTSDARDQEYIQKINLKENNQESDLIGNINLKQFLSWQSDSIPIYSILNDQQFVQQFISSLDYQPLQRNITFNTFNIVGHVELETIEFLERIASGINKPSLNYFKYYKKLRFQNIQQEEENEEFDNQSFHGLQQQIKTMIASGSPRNTNVLLDCFKDQKVQQQKEIKLKENKIMDKSDSSQGASNNAKRINGVMSDPVKCTKNEFGDLNVKKKYNDDHQSQNEYSDQQSTMQSSSGDQNFQNLQAPSTISIQSSIDFNEISNNESFLINSFPKPNLNQLQQSNSQKYLQHVKTLALNEIEKSKETKLGVMLYVEPQVQFSKDSTQTSLVNQITNDQNNLTLLASFLKDYLMGPAKIDMRQILIISPSQSLGDILYNELAFNNIVQIYGQKKGQNKPCQEGITMAANFFGKTIKYFEKRSAFKAFFEEEKNNFKGHSSLIMMSPKQAHEYLMRRIIRVDDFQLIIFQDLSSFNDKHHQWVAEDFYLDCQLQKRPPILSLFSQKPKAPQEGLDWVQENQKSFTSKLLKLDLSIIDLIENQEMRDLVWNGQQSVEMNKFNQEFVVPLKSCCKPEEWLRFHEHEKSKAFDPEESGALTLREGQQMLRYFLEEVGRQCGHENCRDEVTEETQMWMGVGMNLQKMIKESKRCDPIRRHGLMETLTDKHSKGETPGYKSKLIVLPHCVKRFLNDIDYTTGQKEIIKCTHKKDCEAYMCFEVLKQIIKMGLVDQHFHLTDLTLQYIRNGSKNKMIQQKIMTQEESQKIFTNISNDYIQRPFQASKTLYIHAAVNYHKIQTLFPKKAQKQQNDSQEEEIKEDHIQNDKILYTSQSIGFLFPDNRLENKDMRYEMQIDPQQRLQHMEYLISTGQAKDKKEAFNMTKHHEEIIPYNLGTEVIPYAVDKQYKNLQELKCFHVWSMHSIANMESVFIRNLLKGKYTFSKELFNNEIISLFQRHPEASQEYIQKFQVRNFSNEQLSEAHHYVIPLIGKVTKKKIDGKIRNVSEFKVNVQLIKQVIAHIRTQIINSFIPTQAPHHIDYKPAQKIQSYMWSHKGMKQIVKVSKFDDELSNIKQLGSKKEVKLIGLSEAQQFLVNNAFIIDKKQSLNCFKFRKISTFVDSSATKSAYSLQDKKVQKEIDNALICKDKEFKIEFESLQSKLQSQTVPGQLVESYPLNYEIFSILQSACSHYLKLNDFLRTEEYIKQNFTGYPTLTQDYSVLKFEAAIQQPKQVKKDKKLQSIQEILLNNLSIVNAALTAPQTQLAINNERLKTYGDSLLSLQYSVDIYLNRSQQDTEKDLDSLRKQYNSKQNLDLVNIRHKVYQYQLIDCQSQQPVTINPDTDSKQKIVDSVVNRHYTIHKNVIPGALGDSKYSEKMKNVTKYNNSHSIFQQKLQIETLQKESMKAKESTFRSCREFNGICEILNLIFTTKFYIEAFKMRFPKEAELFNSLKGQSGNLIENYATLLISDFDMTVQELQAFIIEQNLEKMQKPKLFKQKSKPLQEESSTDLAKAQSQIPPKLQPLDLQKKQASRMTFQINNDQKLGEAIEALLATVTLTCGVQEGYNFMRHLGIFKNDLSQLQQKVDLERKQGPSAASFAQSELEWIQKVESIIGYKFGNKDLVQQAFQHQTYCSFAEKNDKIKLKNYNLLEFIGDSVMNFLVVDFYFKNSQRSDLSKIYGHDQIHKLKTELTNNNFIAIAMIELGLHEFIKKKERTVFNNTFASFVQIIQEQVFNDRNGQAMHTQEIFKKYFLDKEQGWLENPQVQEQYKKCIGKYYVPKKIKFKEVFMEPSFMKLLANITENERINIEETESFQLKIFADVLEALIGAIFIDTGCDLNKTRDVFMSFYEPYLYVYGNLQTVQDHPKTELIQYWNKFPYGKIHGKPIVINHTNHLEETKSDETQDHRTYIYKGHLGVVEVLNESYEFQVKNKVKQFYRYFLQFMRDLVEKELNVKFPYFQKDLEILNKMEKMKPEAAEYGALKSQLRHGKSFSILHSEVIKSIQEFKEKWNKHQ